MKMCEFMPIIREITKFCKNKETCRIIHQKAFTLSEILITLAVVGVVAVMTLPSVINNINDKQYDRARARILMIVGEAGRLLAVNGEINSAASAKDFVENYLSKQLKIVKMCDNSHLTDCGLSAKIKILGSNDTINMPKKFSELGLPRLHNESTWYPIRNNASFGFITSNGYSMNLFYNPNCTTDTNKHNLGASGYACFNVIYDMNGLRNPNQVGKDIGFVTLLYPNETSIAVAPNPTGTENYLLNWSNANKKCSNLGKEYFLPDKSELLSMAINGNLIGITEVVYWSSSRYNNNNAYVQNFELGNSSPNTTDKIHYVKCVKK